MGRVVVVRLKGGMGNQMFQYACGRAVAERRRASLLLDLHFLLDRQQPSGFTYRDYELNKFHVSQAFASPDSIRKAGYSLWERLRARLEGRAARWTRRAYEELPGRFQEELLQDGASIYLDGYWQSPRYFSGFEHVVKEDFRQVLPPVESGCEMEQRIDASNAVCVHVRRTDFLNSNSMPVCDLEYFKSAVSYIRERVEQPVWFVFSDDLEWCQSQLGFLDNAVFVGGEIVRQRMDWYHLLMRSCRHFIIPNSTYGWWAAYLSWAANDSKIVVVPKRWFGWDESGQILQQLLPSHWVSL